MLEYLVYSLSDKAFKRTALNRAFPPLHGGLSKFTLNSPFKRINFLLAALVKPFSYYVLSFKQIKD